MRLVGPSSVDEMVLAWVRAEADSPRWGGNYANLDRRLIGDEADPTDPAQNRARRAALHAYRRGFYDWVPDDTSWQRWALTPAELGDVRFAGNVPSWHRLSDGTRRVRDGARNARGGLVIVTELGEDLGAGIREIARAIDDGHQMPELIAVAKDPSANSLVLMEGHCRATAYVVARKPSAEVIVLVGWSRTMDTTWQPWF